MKIPTFKFHGTDLYVVKGVVSRGVLLPPGVPVPAKVSWAICFLAAAIFTAVALRTAGPSYAVRAGYALANVRAQFSVLEQDANMPLPNPLPLSAENAAAAIPGNTEAALSMTLVIQKLGVSVPVIEVASSELKAVNEGLAQGVVHWPQSAPLGEKGISVLLGHSSAPLNYKGEYGSVFALIDKLKEGDNIVVRGLSGEMSYRVRDRITVDPKRPGAAVLSNAADSETLVLVSCWPVGSDLKRLAVRAERVL